MASTIARYQASLERLRQSAIHTNQALIRAVARLAPSEQNRIFGLTLAIGGVCGLVAVIFHLAIRGASGLLIQRALNAPGDWWILWTIGTPAAGGLIAGIILHYLVPQARGSGVPQVKLVYTIKSGRIRFRDVIGKFVVSVLQLGTGASLGREGPTVQICAGVSSSIARLFALSPMNQRRMLPVGAAAGIAAAFNAPIAAVTFVIEELVGALDTTVLSGVVVAAAIAAVVEHTILGEHPVFEIPNDYGLRHASSLVVYAILGLCAAVVSHLFSRGLLRLRGHFATTKTFPPWARPSVGGLVTGFLAVIGFLAVGKHGVTGDGYATLAEALHGNLLISTMIVLGVAKTFATIFSYGTGGSGGLFAPVLFIGGMLGGIFGYLDHWMFGHPDLDIGAFALVGMGAVFAGVIRAPITSVLLMFEMTGGYGLVLPLMVANTFAYIFARQWQHATIYEALLEQDGVRLPNTSEPLLSTLQVGDAMTSSPVTLCTDWTVREARERVTGLPYASFPLVDREGRLVGLVSEGRLRRMDAEGANTTMLSEFARPREYLRPSESLRRALEAMSRLGVRQMAVVADDEPNALIGILAMSDVMRTMIGIEGTRPAPPRTSSVGPITEEIRP